jgi:hypothetical protein
VSERVSVSVCCGGRGILDKVTTDDVSECHVISQVTMSYFVFVCVSLLP